MDTAKESTSVLYKHRESCSTVWIAFKGCLCERIRNCNVVFEFIAANVREFSRVVKASPTGEFSNTIECALDVNAEHKFILHMLDEAAARCLKIDEMTFHVGTKAESLIRFSLDLQALLRDIALAEDGIIAQRTRSSEDVIVLFDASDTEPIYKDEGEIVPITSPPESEGPSRTPHSFLHRNGDFEKSVRSRPRSMQVKFDKDIHEIPTTEELQDEIQLAVEERGRLSDRVGDLSVQLFQMRHEMRDIKESLRQVTRFIATKTRGNDMRSGEGLQTKPPKRRRVVLDGNVIAQAYGKGDFKMAGIHIALHHYLAQDINAVAIVTRSKVLQIVEQKENEGRAHEKEQMDTWIERGLLSVTPSQNRRGLVIIKYAMAESADIITNENYQSVIEAQASPSDLNKLKTFLEHHVVPFTFVGERFIPSSEPVDFTSLPAASKSLTRSDTF